MLYLAPAFFTTFLAAAATGRAHAESIAAAAAPRSNWQMSDRNATNIRYGHVPPLSSAKDHSTHRRSWRRPEELAAAVRAVTQAQVIAFAELLACCCIVIRDATTHAEVGCDLADCVPPLFGVGGSVLMAQ